MKKSIVFLLFIGAMAFPGLALRPSAAVEMQGVGMPFQNAMQASITRGKQVYVQVCLACHMATAIGVEGMNPPLIKTKFVLGDKSTLVKIVLNGMKGDLDIDGDTYHGVMAPHSELTDQQIADVLTYVRNSFGNKASAVTPAQVKTIRAGNKQAK